MSMSEQRDRFMSRVNGNGEYRKPSYSQSKSTMQTRASGGQDSSRQLAKGGGRGNESPKAQSKSKGQSR